MRGSEKCNVVEVIESEFAEKTVTVRSVEKFINPDDTVIHQQKGQVWWMLQGASNDVRNFGQNTISE